MRFGVLLAAVLLVSGCSSVTDGQGSAPPAGRHRSEPTRPVTPAPTISRPPRPAASSRPAGASGTPRPAPAALRTLAVTGNDGTTYQVSVWAEDRIADCAAHSYGKVVQYFQQHPCHSATRRLVTLLAGGRTVALSAIVVACAASPPPNPYVYAAQFVQLEKADGTGSINDLLREGARLPGVTAIPAQEVFQVLSQDTGVFVFDAWYLNGPTPAQDPALTSLAENLIFTAVTN